MNAKDLQKQMEENSIINEASKAAILATVKQEILGQGHCCFGTAETKPLLYSERACQFLKEQGYNSYLFGGLVLVHLPRNTWFLQWRYPMKDATLLLKHIAEKGALLPEEIKAYEDIIGDQIPKHGVAILHSDKGGILYNNEHRRNVAKYFGSKGFLTKINPENTRHVEVRLPRNLWEKFLTWF